MAHPDKTKPRGAFAPPPIEAPRDTRRTVGRLLGYFGGNKALIVAAIVFIAAATILRTLVPAMVGEAIELDLELSHDIADFVRRMRLVLVAVLGAWIADAGAGILMTRLAVGIVYRLREESFAHVQTLSMGSFDRRGVGDFISRMTNDVEMVFNAMNNGFSNLVGGMLSMVAVLVAMFALSVKLSLVVLAVVPVMAVLAGVVGSRIRGAFRRNQEWVGRLTAAVEESVSGVKAIQAFRREEAEFEKFDAVNEGSRRAGATAEFTSYAFIPLMNVVTSLTLGLIVGVGGWLALGGAASAKGGVSIGLLTAFILYSQRFFDPLHQVTQVYSLLQSALAGAERLFELMDARPEVVERPDAMPLADLRGAVAFEHVGFAYGEGEPVLEDVSFETRPGQVVAVVGPTGAGKTTLVNLLSRFYDVCAGRITIDGRDIRDLEIDGLRSCMGVVLQEPFFFAASIRENLLYARPDATEEEMRAAARTANADGFVSRLPDGYDTVLAERGGNLSQGERQLLGIARAILADPKILVLDEATSSVDSLTEARIQEGLVRLMKGRTSFIIAHRLSTIRDADLVLVLHGRRIAESGTHDELMKRPGGFYARLYGMQRKKLDIHESDF
ncbi:MAG: ABC transporter ATP-binding protein/permease [Acidobacteriota bacterium]|jgi:ABC-type multidrug transport system fused ATPase/permease subunit|nr:ABC transporter ATP-binding protein/permease [Acidobacteriota bacterium]